MVASAEERQVNEDLTEAECAVPDYGDDRDPHNGALDDAGSVGESGPEQIQPHDAGTIVTPEGWHE